MVEFQAVDLGGAWVRVLRAVCRTGEDVGGEARELRNVCLAFQEPLCKDGPLATWSQRQPVEEMRKVFFTDQPNTFGHSYSHKIRGPRGLSDLSDVTELLAADPLSKRAAVVLVGNGDGRVPCINTVHFLRRQAGISVSYFARGQDIFRKFYADSVCLHEMGRRVASPLGLEVCQVAGMISSAHVYLADLAEAEAMLAEVERCGDAGVLDRSGA